MPLTHTRFLDGNMSMSVNKYNVVAIGDGEIWVKLGRELSKINNCRLIRIPNTLDPYSIIDKYQFRAIFLLPDAITIYQGSCRAWIQRLRFGPNVNTPIISIVENAARRNNDNEMKQMMRSNIINWILTSKEISALPLLQVLRYCQTTIQRCLVASAEQIVRLGVQRASFLRETRAIERGKESSNVMLENPGGLRSQKEVTFNDGKRKTVTSQLEETGGPIPKKVKFEDNETTADKKHTNEGLRVWSTSLTTSASSTTSQTQETSSVQQNTAHVQSALPRKNQIRQRGPANRSISSAQTQTGANAEVSQKKISTPGSKSRLRQKANELHDKLDKAMTYISRVQSLLH